MPEEIKKNFPKPPPPPRRPGTIIQRLKIRNITIGLIFILAAVVGTIIFGLSKRNKVEETVISDDAIPGLQAPPPTPPLFSAKPKEEAQPQPAANDFETVAPRGSANKPKAATPKPTVAGSQVVPAVRNYKSESLGVDLTVGSSWTIDAVQASAGRLTIFNVNTGQQAGTLESYSSINENLSNIEAQLLRSPSVTNIQRVTFSGKEAVEFTSPETGGRTIALIHAGRVYYLTGGTILAQVRFI